MHPHERRYLQEQLEVWGDEDRRGKDRNKARDGLIRYLRVVTAETPNPRSLAKLQADVLESARRAAGAGEVIDP